MSSPFVGEIRLVGFNFTPVNWAFCDGSLLAISQNEALFNLIGTTYGGDGVNTFALPDLRGRVPLHQGIDSFGAEYIIGQIGGAESITLVSQQIPVHSHQFSGSTSPGTSAAPSTTSVPGAVTSATEPIYASASAPNLLTAMTSTNANTGGLSHENRMPFQALNFIISLFGIYPSQG